MSGDFKKCDLIPSTNWMLEHFTKLTVLTWDLVEFCNIYLKIKLHLFSNPLVCTK